MKLYGNDIHSIEINDEKKVERTDILNFWANMTYFVNV